MNQHKLKEKKPIKLDFWKGISFPIDLTIKDYNDGKLNYIQATKQIKEIIEVEL